MTPHWKKLIGTIGLLAWLVLYSLIAMAIGAHILPRAGAILTFLYYLVAGTLWIVPVGLALPWMHREPAPRERP
ncbi:hypothetical protein GCM10008941_13720 [Rhizomicrobium palustre]|nr:DUF2842 domain-containing protein [Rhizomicrobium palustre]